MVKLKFILVLVICCTISYLYFFDNNDKPAIKNNEKFYQTQMCDKLKGKMEFVLPDKSRVDCLTDEYAIEVDWARKWAEGIGQSLYYSAITKKKPAIGLIMANTKADERHFRRLSIVAEKLNIYIIKIKK